MSAQADMSLTKGSASKTKRSFISRLPSFRKKKTPPPKESELDMHLKSAEEDLNGGVKLRPPSQVKSRKEDEVKRRSKTSSIVASYEKRLSDLKDEENRTNGTKTKGKSATLGNHGNGRNTQQDSKTMSRFGFGFTWQKISSIENGTANGKSGRNSGDELNANIKPGSTGLGVRGHSLELNFPPGSPLDRDSTSSVRTPESDHSSVSSNSSAKVYGQPMPYRSVFSDEPRGIKRQASSSQSEGWNSSSISMSRSTSPLHDSTNSRAHHDSSENRLQLNSTFTKDNHAGNLRPDIVNRTFPIEESPTCIVNRTFKLEPAEECGTASQNSEATIKKELPKAAPELAQKENPISCGAVESCSGTAVEKDLHDVSPSTGQSEPQSKSLDEAMPPEQDASRPSASPAHDISTEINSLVCSRVKSSRPVAYLSPRHRHHSGAMGGIQSTGDAFSTPARPHDLAFQLRKPHISAIKHWSESLDSCELDSLCSEDLMCDSKYLDDDMFDTRDESSCLLSRSLSVEETAAMYRTQHVGPVTGRARAVSVDQAQLQATTHSLEKRVGVTRGLAPSPLAIPSGRHRGKSFPAHPVPDELCQSPVEELQLLMYSSSYREADRNKNSNANSSRGRSQSGGNTHPLRPPRWPTLPPDEDGAVLVDAAVYRHMIQDMTAVKTMLFKLKRALQTVDNTASPLEHSLGQISPCPSLPTSPSSEVNPIQEVIIEDLKEENTVLRKEVKNLQELLADAQQHLKELHVQAQTSKPEQCNVSTQITSEVQPTSETKDQSLQVNLPTSSFPSKAPSSSPTRRKCRAEVSKIKAAYEEYIRLHTIKVGELEKASQEASREGSPLKVGRSPTSSPEPSLYHPPDLMETSPPETRRHQQPNLSPPSSRSSPERVQPGKTSKTRIPTSPTKEGAAVISRLPGVPQSSSNESQKVTGSQAFQTIQASPTHKGTSPGEAQQKAGGPKKQTGRSKLMQPVSYKSKMTGSQDSLLSDGSLQDDGSQPVEDRRGGPLKRQLPQPQQVRSTGIPQKSQAGNRQGTSELPQKGTQEANGSTDGIPKPKEIRMMPSRQQGGKLSGLPPRGPIAQAQKDTQPQHDQRESSNVPAKIPSLLPMSKAAAATKQEPTTNRRGAAERQPALIDANSNPVPMQNGTPVKSSSLQQPTPIRRAEQPATAVDTRSKGGPIPTSQFARRKQSPPGLSRKYPAQSPERESSEEEQATPPASPNTRGQQQQQQQQQQLQQQKGSRIALPVRGRGTSKLPRGTGIPRRTNNTS